MTKIVISGYYGFANAGDEAMLAALIGSLKDLMPQAEITVITGNSQLTRENHHVRTVHRLNLPGIAAALSRSDLLISGGGSLLQDVTSTRSLYYYLLIMRMALFFHVPVMLYAQGIGPVRQPKARAAVRKVLQRVQMVSVRDKDSKGELERMGVTKPPIHVTADAVLSIHPADTKVGYYLLKQAGIDGVGGRIGIAVRNWQNLTRFKDEIAKAADVLVQKTGARIIFIPMQKPVPILRRACTSRQRSSRRVTIRSSSWHSWAVWTRSLPTVFTPWFLHPLWACQSRRFPMIRKSTALSTL